jgi:hypothetical protein
MRVFALENAKLSEQIEQKNAKIQELRNYEGQVAILQ